MQQLETFAAGYEDAVDFYIVSFNEDAGVVADYIADRGYRAPFIPAQPVGAMLADLAITRQSAMMALNAHGLILHRQTKGDAAQWPAYLDLLTADPNAAPAPGDAEQQKQQRRQDLQLPS